MDKVYYLIRDDKIIDIILNDKNKAEDTLNKLLKDPSENEWTFTYMVDIGVTNSNELVEGKNKLYTITLNGEPIYSIINNEFSARYIFKTLDNKSKESEYPRNYKLQCDIINYKEMIKN